MLHFLYLLSEYNTTANCVILSRVTGSRDTSREFRIFEHGLDTKDIAVIFRFLRGLLRDTRGNTYRFYFFFLFFNLMTCICFFFFFSSRHLENSPITVYYVSFVISTKQTLPPVPLAVIGIQQRSAETWPRAANVAFCFVFFF